VVAAGVRLHDRLLWTCGILLVVLLLSAIVHYRQFHALVRPLHWLLDDMRESIKTEYLQPVRPRGDREFQDVATAFNGLARALAELYRSKEEKIIVRSRELVRSERLASVGFLAAGVAHEINNPLGVISGYAEMTIKRIRGLLVAPPAGAQQSESEAEAEAEALAGALDAQTMIRDEAFRCKEITNRLLSLSRGGGDGRQKLALDETARQVALLTKGLRNYRDRRIVLEFGDVSPLEVMANPTEMKQVFMNLTVNALEASPQQGEVRIGGQRLGDAVEVFVQDNGKGMSAEMLERVFEPFYTAKRGAGEPGTGLGLSITHAIVESHGGQIRAESRGPGRGSRFTVRLPAIAVKGDGTKHALTLARQG
jgi:signal transduction histidine kinase